MVYCSEMYLNPFLHFKLCGCIAYWGFHLKLKIELHIDMNLTRRTENRPCIQNTLDDTKIIPNPNFVMILGKSNILRVKVFHAKKTDWIMSLDYENLMSLVFFEQFYSPNAVQIKRFKWIEEYTYKISESSTIFTSLLCMWTFFENILCNDVYVI